jgi:hypothetical protein
MNLNDLLQREEPPLEDVLVLRHAPKNAPKLRKALPRLAAEQHDLYYAYQRVQRTKEKTKKPFFEDAKYFASFIWCKGDTALFEGLYKVDSYKILNWEEYRNWPDDKVLMNDPYDMTSNPGESLLLFYLSRKNDFWSTLRGRLEIRWPVPAINWKLWAVDYEFGICPIQELNAFGAVLQKVGHPQYTPLDPDPRGEGFPDAESSKLKDWEAAARWSRVTNGFLRDPRLVKKIKDMYESQCQCCGTRLELPSTDVYAEVHHIQGLGDGGPDNPSNMLCLCANCHALLDLKAKEIQQMTFMLAPGHTLDQRFLDHHNSLFKKRWGAKS